MIENKLKFMLIKSLSVILLFVVASIFPVRAHADINELSKLRFGEFIVTDNTSNHGITVEPNGSFNFSAAFIKLRDPQAGSYEIDGLTPNSLISITAEQSTPLSGANNFFTLRSFQIIHTNPNDAGIATFTLGATAVTSGNGAPYNDQTYNGTIEIQISF